MTPRPVESFTSGLGRDLNFPLNQSVFFSYIILATEKVVIKGSANQKHVFLLLNKAIFKKIQCHINQQV